ncbi:SWIM zinc finger family protein [Myxococcota bacterium]|nr:SWIM zinc finger family protein [Myxococcota bacterium]MBU1379483.1 SWIM zinc finger family protein [Myxococcota bacterium]MBU1497920.1 SWIM zinc finger family protein [Myxococcota bacterium]
MNSQSENYLSIKLTEKEKREKAGLSNHFIINTVEGEHPFFSLFSVKGSNFITYFVNINSLLKDGPNYCTCPDFRWGHLGICKHITAVLKHLSEGNSQAFNWSAAKQPLVENTVFGTWSDGKPDILLNLQAGTEIPFYEDLFHDGKLKDLKLLETDLWKTFLDIARKNKIVISFSAKDITRKISTVNETTDLLRQELETNPPTENILSKPLKSHQLETLRFIVSNDVSIINEEAGTGKRISTIGAIAFLKRKIKDLKVVIVGNSEYHSHWKRLFKIFFPLSVQVMGEKAKDRNETALKDVYLASYNTLLRDIQTINIISPTIVIFDEVNTVGKWRGKTGTLIQTIRGNWNVFLSSGPVTQGSELKVNLLYYINRDKLSPLWQFNDEYGNRDAFGMLNSWDIPPELEELWEQHTLSRKRESFCESAPKKSRFRLMLIPSNRQTEDSADRLTKLFASAASRFNWTEKDITNAVSEIRELRLILGYAPLISNKPSATPKLQAIFRILSTTLWPHNRNRIVIFTHFPEIKNKLMEEIGRIYPVNDSLNDFTDTHIEIKILEDSGTDLRLTDVDCVIHYDIPWDLSLIEWRRSSVKAGTCGFNEYNMVVSQSIEERALVIVDTLPGTIGEWFDDLTGKSITDPLTFKNTVRKLCGRRDERLSSSKVRIDRLSSRERSGIMRRSSREPRTLSSERLFGTSSRNRLAVVESELWNTQAPHPSFEGDDLIIHFTNILEEQIPIIITVYSFKIGKFQAFTPMHFSILGNAIKDAVSITVLSEGIEVETVLDLAFGSEGAKLKIINPLSHIKSKGPANTSLIDVVEATLGIRTAWDEAEIKRLYESERYSDLLELGKSTIRNTWSLLSYISREMMFYVKENGERHNYIIKLSDIYNRNILETLKSKARI